MLGAEVWVALAAPHAPPPVLRFTGVASSEARLTSSEKIGGPPPALRVLAVSTGGTLQTDFSTAEAGKTAYYALRSLSTRGQAGPWSEVCAATVAA